MDRCGLSHLWSGGTVRRTVKSLRCECRRSLYWALNLWISSHLMWFEDFVNGPYSARSMVHPLSCTGLSLGSVPVFRCWRWKLSPRVVFRRSTWVWGWLYRLQQPCPTRRPRYTFLAPSVSTLFEPIININSNVKTKNMFECLSNIFTKVPWSMVQY
jgi:hypothetical protein